MREWFKDYFVDIELRYPKSIQHRWKWIEFWIGKLGQNGNI